MDSTSSGYSPVVGSKQPRNSWPAEKCHIMKKNFPPWTRW